MKQMSKQEIFTRVAVHLLRQKVRSVLPDGVGCAYRGKHGTKCAIGALIPDEECTKEFLIFSNCSGVQSPAIVEILKRQGIETNNHRTWFLLRDLQVIHDAEAPHLWEKCLQSYAHKNYFTMPRIADIDDLTKYPATEEISTEAKEGALHE